MIVEILNTSQGAVTFELQKAHPDLFQGVSFVSPNNYDLLGIDETTANAFVSGYAESIDYEKYLQGIKYKKRLNDGVQLFLEINAEFLALKLAGAVTREQNKVIEEEMRTVREEIVLGQWVTAKDKLIEKGDAVLGASLYARFYASIDNYIAENY